MDGLPALPALPSAAPAPALPPGMPGGPLPQRAAAPVGRPSNDPAEQERRTLRSQEHQRLAALTPPRAKDSKLLLFEMHNGRPDRKPAVTLLASQIEEEMKALSGEPEDERLDAAVTKLLPDDVDNCRLRCQWYSKDGRPIPDTATWEMELGDPDTSPPSESDDLDSSPFDQPPAIPTFGTGATMPPPPPPVAPPPPPSLDLTQISRSFREERNDERRNSEGTFNVLATMMQASQNLQIQLQNQARTDAAAAEERADKRRSEFRTTMLGLIPLVLPMIQAMFGPKGMSAETTALIEILKAGAAKPDSGHVMMEGMIKMQGELTAQTMKLQAEGAAVSAQMQAAATQLVFKQLMDTLKETMALKTQPAEEKEPSVWSQIAEVATPLLAGLTGQNNPAQPQPQLEQQQQPAAQQRRPVQKPPPPPAIAAPAGQTVPPAPARPPQRTPESYPDKERVVGALRSVRRMALGEFPPERHWDAVRAVVRWMPDTLRAAVKAQDRQQILTLATEAALSDTISIQWVTDEANQKFLERTLVDARLLLLVEGNLASLTEEQQQAGIIEHRNAVETRRRAAQSAAAAANAAQIQHNSPALPGEAAPAKPVEASVVTDPAGMVANPSSAAVPEATVVPPASGG
jgi:hypothetical protein